MMTLNHTLGKDKKKSPKTSKKILTQIQLSTKIKLGFLCLIGLSILVAVLSNSSIGKIESSSHAAQKSSEVLGQLNKLSLIASDFIYKKDAKLIPQLKALTSEIEQKIKSFEDKIAERSEKALKAFSNSLQQSQIAYSTKSTAIKEMQQAIDEVVKAGSNTSKSAQNILSTTKKTVKQKKKEIESFSEMIGELSQAVSIAKRLEDSLANNQPIEEIKKHAKSVRKWTKFLTYYDLPSTMSEKVKFLSSLAIQFDTAAKEGNIEKIQNDLSKYLKNGEKFSSEIILQMSKTRSSLVELNQLLSSAYSKTALAASLENDARKLALAERDFRMNPGKETLKNINLAKLWLEASSKRFKDSWAASSANNAVSQEMAKKGAQDSTLIFAAIKRFGQAFKSYQRSDERSRAQAKVMGDTTRSLLETVSAFGVKQVDQVAKGATYTKNLVMSVSAISILAAIILAWILSRSVSRPIAQATKEMTSLANGDLNTEVSGLTRGDEIGSMAKALEIFKNTALERKEMELNKQKEQVAQHQRAEYIEKKIADFDTSVGDILTEVSSAISQMEHTAQEMSENATLTSSRAISVSSASDQASNNIQTVAGSTEQMADSVSEISMSVQNATQITSTASDRTKSTSKTVEELTNAANSIGKVAGLIQEIAEQTNLLALNATIEAARVGEAGKGFAVVAAEVKALANQTASATEVIDQEIEKIQISTNHAATAINDIGQVIDQLSDVSLTISSAVEEQSISTSEISKSVYEAATGSKTISNEISDVSQAAERTGELADEVLEVGQSLNKRAEMLRTKVASFLKEVQAA